MKLWPVCSWITQYPWSHPWLAPYHQGRRHSTPRSAQLCSPKWDCRQRLLASETWQCNRSHISLKATIDVPLLGTVIEQNGDRQLDDSLMPVGWPPHLDGAVKQWCVHRTTTFQELTDLLSTYDMKRDLLELNDKAAHWGYGAVWNHRHMDSSTSRSMRPKKGCLL